MVLKLQYEKLARPVQIWSCGYFQQTPDLLEQQVFVIFLGHVNNFDDDDDDDSLGGCSC